MAQNDLVVVGIDVAKGKVDACIRRFTLRQTFPNTAQGHRKLVAWLRKYQVSKAVMEASGGYEREWRNVLHDAVIEVRIVDPRRVRNFALSAGRLAKNDPIDAEMIAWFAETFRQAPGQIPDAAREELAALAKARKALVDVKIRLLAQNEHAAPEPARKAHARVIKSLAAEIAKLEAAISARVKAVPEFAELAEIIESVPGLAQATSAILIAGMPELGQVSDEVVAVGQDELRLVLAGPGLHVPDVAGDRVELGAEVRTDVVGVGVQPGIVVAGNVGDPVRQALLGEPRALALGSA